MWPRALLLLLLSLSLSAARAQDPPCVVTADLKVDLEAGTIEGDATLSLRWDGKEPLSEVPLVLYPNRFREPDPAITDVAWDRFYPWWFDEGRCDLVWVRGADHRPLAWRELELPGAPVGTALSLTLPTPLQPGQRALLRVRWRIDVPSRLGTFGVRAGRLVADGGLLPYVPERDLEGKLDPRLPPLPARVAVGLRVKSADPDEAAEVLLDGRFPAELQGADGRMHLLGRSPSLLAGPALEVLVAAPAQGDAPALRVLGEAGDEDRANRIARVVQSAGTWLRRRWMPHAPPGSLTLAMAPLRDRLMDAPSGSLVLYSDRLFHVFPLLRGFHEAEVGRAAIEALIRQALERVELGADRDWIAEALGWLVAREWATDRGGLTGSTIRRALGWLDVIPAVDRLLRAPKFAAADVYYGRFHESWFDVPDEFGRALWRRQRGRVVAEKLREKLTPEQLTELLQGTLRDPRGSYFKTRATELVGADLGPFFALWLGGKLPEQNLVLAGVETIEELGDDRERIRVRIRREGGDEVARVGEPVTVQGEDPDGEPITARWAGFGPEGEVELVVGRSFLQPIVLDPEGRVAQAFRGDDEQPRLFKLLFNRFRVRFDLNQGNRNEVAVGVTIHPMYDYSQAIVLDGYYEQDERGVSVGYGYGFGRVIDERTYGAGVWIRGGASDLTTGVLEDRTTLEETEGSLVSLATGLGLDTRLYQQDPTWGLSLNLGVEYTDKWFGTDFRYAATDGEVSLVLSPWRGTTLGMELLLGQIEGNQVPTQRLYDAGGEGTIRGVETSRFVDRALLAFRTEVRQTVVNDLDLPLLWVAWLRKVQVVAFVDTGDVGRNIEDVVRGYEDWKLGAGGGVRVFVDAFGVNSVTARFDVGFRLDEREDQDPQYYFGLGQSF